MSAISSFTVSVLSAERFVVVGSVANGKRLCCDSRAASYFPANTKAREELLKACRWLASEKIPPISVDYQNNRGTTIRVTAKR